MPGSHLNARSELPLKIRRGSEKLARLRRGFQEFPLRLCGSVPAELLQRNRRENPGLDPYREGFRAGTPSLLST